MVQLVAFHSAQHIADSDYHIADSDCGKRDGICMTCMTDNTSRRQPGLYKTPQHNYKCERRRLCFEYVCERACPPATALTLNICDIRMFEQQTSIKQDWTQLERYRVRHILLCRTASHPMTHKHKRQQATSLYAASTSIGP